MTYDEAVTRAAITIYTEIRNMPIRQVQSTMARWAVEEAKVLVDELVESGIKYDTNLPPMI